MQKSALSRTFRRTIFKLHTWIGLHICIALGLIFFSGTILMFSPELKTLTQPSLWISPTDQRVTVGKLYDTTRATFPDQRVDSIGSQPRPWLGRPAYLQGTQGAITVHLNPHSGDVLGVQTTGKLNLRNLIRKLHDSLLVPFNAIHILVNALSFVVLFLIISGLITYRKFWKGFFKGIPKGSRELPRQSALHRRFAIWATPFLILSTLASAVFFLNAIGFKTHPAKPPTPEITRQTALPQDFNGNNLNTLLASCQESVPGFIESGIKFPKTGKDLIGFTGYDSAIGQIFGMTTCYADPSTRTVTGITRASEGNQMTQIKSLAIAIHFGTFGGWITIVLWTLFGAASTYVAISGARVYAARSNSKALNSHNATRESTWTLLIKGLGYFKWLYLVWALGVIALIIKDLI